MLVKGGSGGDHGKSGVKGLTMRRRGETESEQKENGVGNQ